MTKVDKPSKPSLVDLGEIVEIISGFAFKSSQFNDSGEGLPVVRIRDVLRGFSKTYYSGDFDAKYLVVDGDYLIGMDGEFNLAKWKGGKALLNQRVCKIREVDESLNRHYLSRFLPMELKNIEDATPFVTVKHLSVKKIKEIQIPLPPLEEQKRIAGILDAADALRAKRRETLEQLDQLAQSTFLEMFGDGIEDNKSFNSVSIGDIAIVKGGKRLPKGEQFSDVPTSHRYIRVQDMSPNMIRSDNLKYLKTETQSRIARYVVAFEDVVISIAGTIGVTAVVPKELNGVNLTENAAKIVIQNKNNVDSFYLSWALQMPNAQFQIKSYTGQVAVAKLALFRIEKIRISLPPLSLQKEFASIVESIEKQKERVKAHLEELDTLFSSLQSRAFKGEL